MASSHRPVLRTILDCVNLVGGIRAMRQAVQSPDESNARRLTDHEFRSRSAD